MSGANSARRRRNETTVDSTLAAWMFSMAAKPAAYSIKVASALTFGVSVGFLTLQKAHAIDIEAETQKYIQSVSPNVTADNLTTFNDAKQLPAPIAGKNYTMTFDDEFTSLQTISGKNTYDGAKWYNGVEQCCMTNVVGAMYPSKVNGRSVNPYSIDPESGLGITLSKNDNAWYSGILTSVDQFGKGFSQKYGYFEIRAKMPAGPGTWPAFWMKSLSNLLTHENIGELDIFEQYAVNAKGFCTTYHDWSNAKTPYYNCKNPTADLTQQFHTWGLLWTDSKMSVYFDDKEINQTDTPSVAQQAYYLILDLGIGGGWPTDQTPNSNTLHVSYVRAYAEVSPSR